MVRTVLLSNSLTMIKYISHIISLNSLIISILIVQLSKQNLSSTCKDKLRFVPLDFFINLYTVLVFTTDIGTKYCEKIKLEIMSRNNFNNLLCEG